MMNTTAERYLRTLHWRYPGLSVIAVLALLTHESLSTAQSTLDQSCTVTVRGLTSGVGSGNGGAGGACGSSGASESLGSSWSIANVPATPEPMRAEATCNRAGTILYGTSSFFDILVGGSVCAGGMVMSTSPPPHVASILSGGISSINLSQGNTGQVAVTGIMTSGGGGALVTAGDNASTGTVAGTFQQDLTLRSAGTGYASSNPAIASVDINGHVTGHSPGIVYITMTNQGATAVRKVTVSNNVTSTTIEGFVQLSDGTGENDAIVRCTLGVETATSSGGASAGYFSMSLPNIPTEQPIVLYVAADTGTQAFFQQTSLTPVPNGVTDAGIIVLNSVFDPFSDSFSRAFSVYNHAYDETIHDSFSREFSVYNAP